MSFCTQCGNELREGMRFCPECGTPVTAFEAADPMIEAQAAEEPATEVPIVEAQAAGTVVDAVKAAAEAIVQTIDAPVSAGETVLSTWQGAGAGFDSAPAVSAATQAVGTVICQAQKVAQETQPIAAQVEQLAQPAQPVGIRLWHNLSPLPPSPPVEWAFLWASFQVSAPLGSSPWLFS